MGYRLLWDLHTHTVYSRHHHGKGTVEQNAAAAQARGLVMLGITDHGPGHGWYGLDLSMIPQIRREIEEAALAHPGLAIRLGVEANLVDRNGELDVSIEEQKLFDFIIAGYHLGARGHHPLRSVEMQAGAIFYSVTMRSSKRALIYNTDVVVNSLYNNDIYILTHPGEKAAFDMKAIVQACEATDTVMEINDHHRHLTVDDIRLAMDYNVRFSLGSDAHRPEDVGRTGRALARALEAGLPPERIINLGKESHEK